MVERVPGVPRSTTVLVRGAPGAGKTVFGFQLAGAIARALKGDVAYGCIELLPVELQAQHASLRREGVDEEVIVPPLPQAGRSPAKGHRLFAGLLDLGESGEEQARLGLAVHALLNQVERAGGQPRVLVIDSLSNGYNLGSSTPRQLADSLCKLAAERGLVLILLEEIVDDRPSSWSFAVDLVLELSGGELESSTGQSASPERRLKVVKHRFGPSHAGLHRFTVLAGQGLRVFPHPANYLEPWAGPLLWGNWRAREPEGQNWPMPQSVPNTALTRPPFRECVTAVYGMQTNAVFSAASQFGGWGVGDTGVPLLVEFGHRSQGPSATSALSPIRIQAENPYLSSHELVADVQQALEQIRRNDILISKALIGDLRALRSFWTPERLRRAIAVVVSMLRQVRIPVVLFETAEARAVQPQVLDFADVFVEITQQGHLWHANMVVPRTGYSAVFSDNIGSP